MSDAKQQSVERCKYGHEWIKGHGEHPIPRVYFECSKCGYRPQEDSKFWHEAESIVHLREVLKPGDTVYTVLRHVSRSGMSRNIDLYLIKNNEPMWISAYVGHAVGSPQSRKNWERSRGLTVGGCGMDMGFHLVYNLGRVLFRDGFGEECRLCHRRPVSKVEADDATAPQKRTSCAVKEPFRHEYFGRNGNKSGWDNDGGYALNHKWL